jgi:hypothetical protein
MLPLPPSTLLLLRDALSQSCHELIVISINLMKEMSLLGQVYSGHGTWPNLHTSRATWDA